MSGFKFSTAFIGPFAVSVGTAKAGDVQKLRYKVPASRDLIGQGTFVLNGSIEANWSSGASDDQQFGVGGDLTTDRKFKEKVLVLNEDLTLTALTDCSYLCASAVGVKQKSYMERQVLEAGQELLVPRFELLIIGEGAVVSINGKQVGMGPRLVYARSQELHVKAHATSVVATLSFKA